MNGLKKRIRLAMMTAPIGILLGCGATRIAVDTSCTAFRPLKWRWHGPICEGGKGPKCEGGKFLTLEESRKRMDLEQARGSDTIETVKDIRGFNRAWRKLCGE